MLSVCDTLLTCEVYTVLAFSKKYMQYAVGVVLKQAYMDYSHNFLSLLFKYKLVQKFLLLIYIISVSEASYSAHPIKNEG